jgi:hypothetical protein
VLRITTALRILNTYGGVGVPPSQNVFGGLFAGTSDTCRDFIVDVVVLVLRR